MKNDPVVAIGWAAALAAAVETVVFAFSLVWGLVFHSAFDQNLGYAASLLLAVSVVTLMACLYSRTPQELHVYGLLALTAAILYAPLCIGVYFIQLSIVALNPLQLSADVMKALDFEPGSPAFAIDMLGYGFLCLSTLAAAFALVSPRDRALRALCFFHGALAVPTLAAPIMSALFMSPGGAPNDTGSYVLLFWCAVFTPIALLFMRHFREASERHPRLALSHDHAN